MVKLVFSGEKIEAPPRFEEAFYGNPVRLDSAELEKPFSVDGRVQRNNGAIKISMERYPIATADTEGELGKMVYGHASITLSVCGPDPTLKTSVGGRYSREKISGIVGEGPENPAHEIFGDPDVLVVQRALSGRIDYVISGKGSIGFVYSGDEPAESGDREGSAGVIQKTLREEDGLTERPKPPLIEKTDREQAEGSSCIKPQAEEGSYTVREIADILGTSYSNALQKLVRRKVASRPDHTYDKALIDSMLADLKADKRKTRWEKDTEDGTSQAMPGSLEGFVTDDGRSGETCTSQQLAGIIGLNKRNLSIYIRRSGTGLRRINNRSGRGPSLYDKEQAERFIEWYRREEARKAREAFEISLNVDYGRSLSGMMLSRSDLFSLLGERWDDVDEAIASRGFDIDKTGIDKQTLGTIILADFGLEEARSLLVELKYSGASIDTLLSEREAEIPEASGYVWRQRQEDINTQLVAEAFGYSWRCVKTNSRQ